MAAADLDGDGDLDVVVNRLGSPALVLRNNASAPRVAVRLIGDAPNTRAVGSKMRLLGGAVPTQEREVVVGGLYMSHSDYEASFAMGEADSATLVVEWRDGRRTTISGVRPNRLYEITTQRRSRGRVAARGPERRHDRTRDSALFEDATAQLGGHDTRRPTVRRLGAAVSAAERAVAARAGRARGSIYDRDGYEDLLVGTGKGGRLARVPQPTRPTGRWSREQGPCRAGRFHDRCSARRTAVRIVAGVSNVGGEAPMTASRRSAMPANARGVAHRRRSDVAPSRESATGPMALADYNGDGTLDLFVGGRARSRCAIPSLASSSGCIGTMGGTLRARHREHADARATSAWSPPRCSPTSTATAIPIWCSRASGGRSSCSSTRNGQFVRAPDVVGPRQVDEPMERHRRRRPRRRRTTRPRRDELGTQHDHAGGQRASAVHASTDRSGGNGEIEMLLAQHDPRLNALGAAQQLRAGADSDARPARAASRRSRAYADATLDTVLGTARGPSATSCPASRWTTWYFSIAAIISRRSRCRWKRNSRRRPTPASPTSTATATKTSS